MPTVTGKSWGVKPLQGKITEHFAWSEAVCHCCGRVLSVEETRITAYWLEAIRSKIGNRIIHVNSWNRCPQYNRRIGGASRSYHMRAKAADVTIRDLTIEDEYKIFQELQKEGIVGGLGKYIRFTHIDRGPVRNWNGP